MNTPKVAIVTRTLDRPEMLGRALGSVLRQTFEDWVWVVVNSGDPGPVEALIERHAERLRGRVNLVQTGGPGSIAAAANAGIEAVDSHYIVLLDDDDTFEEQFLEKTVDALEMRTLPSVRGVVTWTTRVDEERRGSGYVPIESKVLNPTMENLKLFQLASVNQFTVNAFLYERTAYEEVGPYRDDLPVLDDWEFNLRFLQRFDIDVIPEALANYHVRPAATVGAEANTLTSGRRLHKFYEAQIANDLLRRDLERGETGLGFLLNLAAGFRVETELMQTVFRKIQSMSTKVGRIDSRTKRMKDNTPA